MKRGEVYWADLNPRSGSEQHGRREDGPWDPSKPEVVLGDPSDWYLEPHYSFDVGFIPNTPYAEFDTEEADHAIVAVSGFVAVELMKEIARHPKILLRIERCHFENAELGS
jgi:hypothetical protein